jgi:hypothetical protein
MGVAYPHRAEYKKKKNEEEEEIPKKPHLRNLCERCTSGLECSAVEQELASMFRGLRV